MTTLLIKADIPRKRARLEGTIAAGEHVAVTIKDLGSLASSKTLNLRVMYGPRTIAQFPAPGTQDEWESSGADLVCKLNLNTVQAKRECGSFPENECLFVLEEAGSTVEGEEEDPTLYFVAQKDVMGWPKNHFGEPPYDLDKFPGLVRAWTAQMLVWSGYMEKWGISAVKIGGVVTISITDRYGAVTQVQVKDGRDGVDGQDGVQIDEVNEIVEGAVAALSESVDEKLGQKQDTLIAGANITINNGVISASGGGGGGSVTGEFDMECSDWDFRRVVAEVWKAMGGTVVNEE